MSVVLHFRKELHEPPVVGGIGDIRVRSLAIPSDLASWLAMRVCATAELKPPVRSWTDADFFAEMVQKPWWTAEHSWVAAAANAPDTVVGAVTLAIREGSESRVPVVHWLLVDPLWRRRGVGRLLMTNLELAAWNEGWREVQLETHAGWESAVVFYQSMGYAPLRGEPPR